MAKIAFLFTLLVAALVCLVPAAPAQAQSIRTFVSTAGSDSNPCSLTSPCRHFQAAVNATSAGGEVDALDPGAYGSFTISHAITIEGQGWSYVAPPANGAAITIAATTSDTINIHGVSLNGAGAGGNTTGIVFADGGGLEIVDCTIRNFTQTGVYVGVGSSPPLGTILLISNTRVLDNPTAGIDIAPQAGGAVMIAIDRVTANNNGYGIYMNSATDTSGIRGTITNSVINSNVNAGIAATNPGVFSSSEVRISVKDSNISNNNTNNVGVGISVSNNDSVVVLSHSLINYNGIGIVLNNGGAVLSAGNNDMTANVALISGGSLGSAPEQ
jgi:hypothetical protein